MFERHHLRSPSCPLPHPPPTLSLPRACLPPALCSTGAAASPGGEGCCVRQWGETIGHLGEATVEQSGRKPEDELLNAYSQGGGGRWGGVFEDIFLRGGWNGCARAKTNNSRDCASEASAVNKRGEDGRHVPTLRNRKDTCDRRCTRVWRARRSPVWSYFVHQHESPPEKHTHTRDRNEDEEATCCDQVQTRLEKWMTVNRVIRSQQEKHNKVKAGMIHSLMTSGACDHVTRRK